jgi:glycosyltransferase involved in cell wall biosynthesis
VPLVPPLGIVTNYMRFSIVIPAHNGERYLRETLASAIAQTRAPDEILLVDDASIDATARIAQSAEFLGRIRYVYNPVATGFVDAWNRAAAHASGDYVSILHQDDLLHADYLRQVEENIRRHPRVEHVYAACNYIDGQGRVIRKPDVGSPAPFVLSGRTYAHAYLRGVLENKHIHRCPGVTTSRSLLLNRCAYRKEAGHIADDDFFLRVGGYTDVIGISTPLASFREHPDSATGKLDLLSLRLAQDYLFQSRYHLQNLTLLDAEDVASIHRQTIRFVNLLLFQALIMRKDDWIAQARELRAELNVLLPRKMEQTLPHWAKTMWKLSESPYAGLRPASLYAQVISAAISMRDRFKRLRAAN